MALKVIGAGFGRTGTNSLKLALEKLGFSKCHHMLEIIEHPEQAKQFVAAARGEQPDWDKLYEGYLSCCDWPSCFFWRELVDFYPDAKVILSIRDPESWFKSMSETLIPLIRRAAIEPMGELTDIGVDIVLNRTFSGDVDNKEHVLNVYQQHNQAIRNTVTPDRLLEFDAKQGWEPLCAFLGVPVPAEAYPHANSQVAFNSRVRD